MKFEHYQTQAVKTAIYSDADVITYPILGLCSEVGECTDLGLGMETIARRNLDKLNSRMARGVIKGSGDNR